MEVGKLHSIIDLRKIIQPEDLDMTTKGGFIITAKLGTLIMLRDQLKICTNLVYCTISEQPLYLVHWNDLCEKKQKEIEKKRSELEVK
jgi:hypothetical protein